VKNFCKDLALRPATLLEKVLIAGFPKVPTKTDDKPLFQSGEIAASINSYNNSVEIFTAIARPGNSGSPLLSEDGKVLGIVSENLEDKALNNNCIFFCNTSSHNLRAL